MVSLFSSVQFIVNGLQLLTLTIYSKLSSESRPGPGPILPCRQCRGPGPTVFAMWKFSVRQPLRLPEPVTPVGAESTASTGTGSHYYSVGALYCQYSDCTVIGTSVELNLIAEVARQPLAVTPSRTRSFSLNALELD